MTMSGGVVEHSAHNLQITIDLLTLNWCPCSCCVIWGLIVQKCIRVCICMFMLLWFFAPICSPPNDWINYMYNLNEVFISHSFFPSFRHRHQLNFTLICAGSALRRSMCVIFCLLMISVLVDRILIYTIIVSRRSECLLCLGDSFCEWFPRNFLYKLTIIIWFEIIWSENRCVHMKRAVHLKRAATTTMAKNAMKV